MAAYLWKAPDPRDLPEWRAQVRDDVGSNDSLRSLTQAINAGHNAIFPAASSMEPLPGATASMLMARAEEHRLCAAKLYYATADMTSLALAAASTPPTEPIRKTRLPSPYGFMVFAEPIGNYTHDIAAVPSHPRPACDGAHVTVTTPIVAISWGLWAAADTDFANGSTVRWFNQRSARSQLEPIPQDFEGVWITFYAPPGSAFDTLAPDTVIDSLSGGAPVTAADIQLYPRHAPLTWENETVLAFGKTFDDLMPDITRQCSQVVYTAWQLMSQTGRAQLTEVNELPRDRAGRKRDRRDGIIGPSDVQILNVHTAHRLSPPEQDAAAPTGRRAPQWSCRWPVRPYRRNTCLNPRAHAEGACEHEERIVPAHIKGPNDKPLRSGETVHLWDHQP
ncbi:hypothetical protein [Streptomyces sp. NPDC059003]|uniref:hypothetical protein n=1 Tax=Streptomyces sp. NPDC059003 TaxID=3346691 RepID=UPI0036AE5AED